MIVVGLSITHREAERVRLPKSGSQITPSPMPTPHSLSTAPRAILVKLPPPRAQLIRLPQWKVGEERELLMPNGPSVLGRLRGKLASIDMLPSNGNEVGDTWVVGDTAWVWITQPGMTQASWIDP
jgi:hypothetical protein